MNHDLHASVRTKGDSAPSRRRAVLTRLAIDYASLGFVFIKSLALVPFYLTHFSVGTYGAWLASGNVLGLIGSLEGGFTLVYAQRLSVKFGRRDLSGYALEAGSGGIVLLGSATLVCIASAVASPTIPRFVRAEAGTESDLSRAFVLAGIGLAFTLIQSIAGSWFQSWQIALPVGVIKIICQMLEVLIVVLALLRGQGIVAIGLGSALSGFCAVLLTLFWGARYWRRHSIPPLSVSWNEAGRFLRAAGPVFASRISGVLLNNNEPLIAAAIVGPTAAAVVGLTDRVFKIAQIMVNQVSAAVYFGLGHAQGEQTDNSRMQSLIAEALEVGGAFMTMIFSVAIVLNPSFVVLWVGRGQFGGLLLSVLLALAGFLIVKANMLGVLLSGLGGFHEFAVIQVVELLCRVPILYVALSWAGVRGLPIAVIVTSVVVSIPLYSLALARRVQGNRQQALRFAVEGMGTAALAVSAALCVALIWPVVPTWVGLAELAGCALAGSIVLILLFNQAVRRAARDMVYMALRVTT